MQRWEKQLLNNVVPILACLKGRAQLVTVTVEGDTLVGKALAASVVPKTPFVSGIVTQTTVFEEIRKQFLSEFACLDPMSVLEYFRIRLMPVVQERFPDRLPHLREVSIRCVKNKKICLYLTPSFLCFFFQIVFYILVKCIFRGWVLSIERCSSTMVCFAVCTLWRR